MYVCPKTTWILLIGWTRISHRFNRILNTRSEKKHQTMSYKMIKKSDFLLYFRMLMLSISVTFPIHHSTFFYSKSFLYHPSTACHAIYVNLYIYIFRPFFLISFSSLSFIIINLFITHFLSISLQGAVPLFQSCNLTLILQLLIPYYLHLYLILHLLLIIDNNNNHHLIIIHQLLKILYL